MPWYGTSDLTPHSYDCSYCGKGVGGRQGYRFPSDGIRARRIYICPFCDSPTYVSGSWQSPGAPYGNSVEHLPQEIENLYEEARQCMSVRSYTSAVLSCRKLLMHIAVEKEATKGKSFIYYVKYLSDNGYVPPNGKGWVDLIRKKGNEANHEINLMSKDDAEQLISFLEMLLKFIYEFPAKVPEETVKTE